MASIVVGTYLMERVKQLGVKSVFGVPGDFELALLDLVTKAELSWKGNPNELIGSYAADGYGRIAGVGALVTTFGPGELSALCGIAGGYCEFVPIIHIVGYPSVKAQKAGAILHHSLGDGKYGMYHEMSKQISCATTVLMDSATAASEIDRCLSAMLFHRQPCYIGVPTDVCFEMVSSSGLQTPIATSLPPNEDKALESKVVEEIRRRLETHDSAIIIVDGGAVRHDVVQKAKELIDTTNLPFFTTLMSKGCISERHPRYGGLYGGSASKEDVKTAVESAECVLWIGNYPSDFNTGEFSETVKPKVIIDFERFWVSIGSEKFDLKMDYLLPKLIESMKSKPLMNASAKGGMPCEPRPRTDPPCSKHISQEWFWTRCGHFFRAGDLVITETGTSAFGMADAGLPGGISLYNQTVFGSIGFATGSAVGAFIAAREAGVKYKRLLLFTGDGSLQLTIQAFADLLRHDVKPIIFVINNKGYTVERMIHGMHEGYNDIPEWKYCEMLHVFGPGIESKSHQVRTSEDVERLFSDVAFNACETAQLVEIFMDPFDAPEAMKRTSAAVDRFNAA